MLEHQYDIRISNSCVDPNRLMVKRQDPHNFPRLQTRERCTLEIAAYVFKRDKRRPQRFSRNLNLRILQQASLCRKQGTNTVHYVFVHFYINKNRFY